MDMIVSLNPFEVGTPARGCLVGFLFLCRGFNQAFELGMCLQVVSTSYTGVPLVGKRFLEQRTRSYLCLPGVVLGDIVEQAYGFVVDFLVERHGVVGRPQKNRDAPSHHDFS